MLYDPRRAFTHAWPVATTIYDRFPGLPKPRKASPRELIERVAVWHRLPTSAILSHHRHARVVHARFDAIAAVKIAYPAISLTRLGMIFDRDHSTIYHALRKRGLMHRP